jgi:6-phospho-3-hexuloisomerase
MTDEPAPGTVGSIATAFARHCARVADAIAGQSGLIDDLASAIATATAIHCHGFGRSGHAAEALAIRLRHFQGPLGDVWWTGDRVRNPFRVGDLLIAVSSHGTGHDLRPLVEEARALGMRLAFVTSEPSERGSASQIARPPRDIVIELPYLDPRLLAPAKVYGGGDFELGAYLLQEALATGIGYRLDVPPESVAENHVLH